MNKVSLQSPRVHAAFGHYSTALQMGETIYMAGHGPFDERQRLVGADIAAQTRQTMENIRCMLEDNGCTMDDVVRCTVYLHNIGDWAAFNEVYGAYFNPPYPVRTVIGAQLNGFLVEIEVTACRGVGRGGQA